jgi:hypothetical protein
MQTPSSDASPAAKELASSSSKSAFRAPRKRSDVLGIFAWVVGIFALIAAFALAFCLAIDLPGMFAAGLPDQGMRLQFQRDLFNNAVPDWPDVLRGVGKLVTFVLTGIALVALVVARRRSSAVHILRVIAGTILLVTCNVFLGKEVAIRNPWNNVMGQPANARGWAGARALFECFGSPAAAVFVIALIVALILLAWPKKRLRSTESGVTG